MTHSSGPDFLCIGAQKAGTTWLYENLRQHPQIWLPPTKEIHYYDRRKAPYFLDAFRRNARTRYLFKRWFRPNLQTVKQEPATIGWFLNYYFLPRNFAWYSALFTKGRDRLSGDITPAYSRLSAEQVQTVAHDLPYAKIIYMIRNPVDRMWSQAGMYFSRYGFKGLEQVDESDLERFFSWPLAIRNSAYRETLSIWSQFYPDEQIGVFFFDELEDTSVDLYDAILKFIIGDNVVMFRPAGLKQKVHAGRKPRLPEKWRQRLNQQFRDEIVWLSSNFDNAHTRRWLAENEKES